MSEIIFGLEAELAPAELDELTRDLMRDLDRVGIRAQPVETPAGPGERGVMTTIGNFVVQALVSREIATAVLEVLKAYLAREKTLHIIVAKPNGARIEIDAKNVGAPAVRDFLGFASSITD